ncbi:MAG: chemotaxis protein CheA [Acidobacteriota bacterium]|nr:chemotaxis protein CheA [Acidobacteriota bacterium]
MDDLTQEFLAESQEGLDRMERCLTEFERRPGDTELVAEIFRAVHTIKGGTGFLGFGRLEALAHAGENLLGSLRAGRVGVTAELIGGLLGLLDGLRAILRLIEAAGDEGLRCADDDAELIARLNGLNEARVEERADGSGAREEPRQESGEASSGPAQPSRAAGGGLGSAERSMESVAGPGVRGAAVPAASGVAASGVVVSSVAASGVVVSSSTLPEQRASARAAEKTLRVDVDVLNRMMNLVGELVLTRNRILQSAPAAEGFAELAHTLDGVTSDLRETVMQARMQPVGHLFGKFPRMVRDLAEMCGRKVRIEFEGQETGLDKSLLEAVRDPLTHAVRNAVDHGIEPPEQRIAAGKDPEGVLRLRAFHHSGAVVIELSDDGAGIAVGAVVEKAVERGLVTAEQAAGLSDREAMHLIFAPGFSTAKTVTSISGRGVGMDVVRANVERVGGTVELESRAGLGTTLRMRVPLTLAIIPALVVRSGGQSFALPQSALVELVYVPEREIESAIERIGAAEVYRLREHLLPLLRLNRLLGTEQTLETPGGGLIFALVEADGCRFGLVVEELLAPEEIVVKPLGAALRRIGLFAGATVLGNGTLALILDVAGIGGRAGVRVLERMPWSESTTPVREVERTIESPMMVVYEVVGNTDWGTRVERAAMPLSAVERIETIEREQIEYVSGQPMLRYRGELLFVDDPGGVLQRRQTGTCTLLICTEREAAGVRRVATLVEHVVDVCRATPGGETRETPAGCVAVVNDRLTLIACSFDEVRPAAALVEVA